MKPARPATRPPGVQPGSLQRRLLLAAAAWITLALGVMALVLVALFRQHAEADLAQRMQAELDGLIGALRAAAPAGNVGDAGNAGDARPAAETAATASSASDEGLRPAQNAVQLLREPSDPAFRQPFSGRYWLVQQADGQRLRSRSLWDHPLDLPLAEVPLDRVQRLAAAGPRGQSLLFWARSVQLPGVAGPVTVASGADASQLEQNTRRFGRTVVVSLLLLAMGLGAAAWLQVRLGLAPLRGLHAALQRLRAGQDPVLGGRHPQEVQPLVDEINGLLADRKAMLDTAHQQTGNLAHALKTPLAVMGNALQGLPPAPAGLLQAQLERMHRQVELHLVRARTEALLRSIKPGQGTAVPPLVDDLLRTLGRLHQGRGLQLGSQTTPAAAGLLFRGQPDALQDMLGNLLDNACQWARGQVRVVVSAAPLSAPATAADTGAGQLPGLCLVVEDDGPGIPVAERSRVLQRGQRLDERQPGTGLGLAIVDELARLHGGSLQLEASPLGGLAARLLLPASVAAALGQDGPR